MFYCYGYTTEGRAAHNEDALLAGEALLTDGEFTAREMKPPFFAAVADGVFSEKSGELASTRCLEMLRDVKFQTKRRLENEIMRIHGELADYNEREEVNMQTTLCALAVDANENIFIVNVGDSRLYRYRYSSLRQLTRDQSLVQILFESGQITAYEKNIHTHKNIILPAMGNKKRTPEPQVDFLGGDIRTGDLFLLCTDGLTDSLTKTDIEDILDRPKSLEARIKELADSALDAGSKDNITVVGLIFS